MKNLLLKMLAKFNLVELVYTMDFDGEIRLRVKRTLCSTYHYVYGISSSCAATLNPDGSCGGPADYIERWKPYKGEFKKSSQEILNYYEEQLKANITSH